MAKGYTAHCSQLLLLSLLLPTPADLEGTLSTTTAGPYQQVRVRMRVKLVFGLD